MAHYRQRYIEGWIEKMLRYSPLVGVFGHRQVGKTTLVTRLSDRYYTLDDSKILATAQNDSKTFLNSIASKSSPVIIDECQHAPALFPALKEFVRINKLPGQFILTGSVRFSARKLIQESLTGRIVNIVIPPLCTSEICELSDLKSIRGLIQGGLGEMQSAALKIQTNEKIAKTLAKSVTSYESLGGLPGVCFVRNDRVRTEKIESQLATILERDLRLIYQTTLPIQTLNLVLQELAAGVGEPLNVSAIQRRTRVSIVTLNKLLAAFHAMFLIDFVSCLDGAAQPLIFFTDSGEAMHLSRGRLNPNQAFAQSIYSNVVGSLTNLWHSIPEKIDLLSFRTRGGTHIPLVFRAKEGIYGILPYQSDIHFESILAQTRSFMNLKNALGVVAVSKSGSEVVRHHEHLLELPYHLLIA